MSLHSFSPKLTRQRQQPVLVTTKEDDDVNDAGTPPTNQERGIEMVGQSPRDIPQPTESDHSSQRNSKDSSTSEEPQFTLPGQLQYLYSVQSDTATGSSTRNTPLHQNYTYDQELHDQPKRFSASSSSTSSSYRWFDLGSIPPHLYVLPVLLLEFLALALTRAILPGLLLDHYGSQTYLVLGCADCVKGLLAFLACPIFGKISDQVGRKPCLWITVLGTCAPVCSLAVFAWHNDSLTEDNPLQERLSWWDRIVLLTEPPTGGDGPIHSTTLPPLAISIFVILLSLSGIFSSTFTLVFAYISDTVHLQEDRVSAYGLALATFGLSFTIGPMAGGYLAQTQPHLVFVASLMLTVVNLFYIYLFLPESRPSTLNYGPNWQNVDDEDASTTSSVFMFQRKMDISWTSPFESVQLITEDPFLNSVGKVALLYYTGLWAVISTLSLYAVQHFGLGPQALGELMSALGLSTMMAEAILVRVLVPLLGERESIKLGLASFAMQCFILGLAYEKWHLFVCVGFSILGNLVYPSLSSLVSGTVEPKSVGEALGAINGIKALTEGIGPLVFGALMTISEKSPTFPGWPYWIASLLAIMAFHYAHQLPPDHPRNTTIDQEYIHELEFKRRRRRMKAWNANGGNTEMNEDEVLGCFDRPPRTRDEEEEYQDLLGPLSEVDEGDTDEGEELRGQ